MMNNGLLVLGFLLLPLAASLMSLLLKKGNGSSSASLIGVALLLAVLFTITSDLPFMWQGEWLPDVRFSIVIDQASGLLLILVLFISLLVYVFSLKYMEKGHGASRYFAKLGLFVFSMLGLLLADNLILLFVFWELVGVSSYLLIGFWYQKRGVPDSAKTAFMVNRVADVLLLAGILLAYQEGATFTISRLSQITLLPSILITCGAFGKSAQVPFSGWLIKAMVGPTPISALIHAATMVAAGVYLLFRTSPFLSPDALFITAFVGTITALYGAVCAMNQHDIKKILAYSTISQLGYMVLSIGVGARGSALFHLTTHAFFKAGLFLGAASIIHYMSSQDSEDAQDMRSMGGLRNQLPWTFRSFVVCGAALAGIPLCSGFLSKDSIILSSWAWANEIGTWSYLLPDLALLVALLTAFYTARMILLIFMGETRLGYELHPEKEPRRFVIPLTILAVCSLWIWFAINPLGHHTWILGFLMLEFTADAGLGKSLVPFLSILLVAAGIVLSYSLFKPGSNYVNSYRSLGMPGQFGSRFTFSGMYLNEVYDWFGRLFVHLAKVFQGFDRRYVDPFLHIFSVGTVVFSKVVALIDRFLVDGPVNGVSSVAVSVGRKLAGFSSRDSQTQLLWLLFFLILILGWIILF